VDLIDTDQ